MATILPPPTDSAEQARRPAPCPICLAPGGFHDRGPHSAIRAAIPPKPRPEPIVVPVRWKKHGRLLCELRLFNCTVWATTRDHIIPKSRGGLDRADNLRPACEPCNTRKGNRLDSELTEYDFPLGAPRLAVGEASE